MEYVLRQMRKQSHVPLCCMISSSRLTPPRNVNNAVGEMLQQQQEKE